MHISEIVIPKYGTITHNSWPSFVRDEAACFCARDTVKMLKNKTVDFRQWVT